MPSRLKFTVGADTDAVRVLYTDTPDADPETLLETVEVEAGPTTFELGESSQPGRRWAVRPVSPGGVLGALSNVVEEPPDVTPPAALALIQPADGATLAAGEPITLQAEGVGNDVEFFAVKVA